jgi:predicted transposase/invertase (TIGR01784 family)
MSQGISQGISQGAEQAKIETAKNLLNMGLTLKQVAQGTGLTLEEVEKLAKQPR